MKITDLLSMYRQPLWEAAGEGGGGGDAGDGGDAGAGEGGEGGGEGGEGGDKGGSILDLASGDKGGEGGKEGEEGDYKAPDTIPEHMRGKDADETLANVMKAYKGARTSLSEGKGKLEGDVPENIDGYTFEADGDDDKLAEEMNSEASKPVVDAFKKAALDIGIPNKAFAAFMRAGLSNAAEAGVPVGLSQEEAVEISASAEMERMVELMGDQKSASTVVNTVDNYGNKLIENGVMAKEDLATFKDMCGTADCSRLFYQIMTAEFGEKAIPLVDGGDASVTSTDAYALHAQASAMPEGAERTAAMAEANKAMTKAFGNNNTGSVRSSVL